MPRLIAYDLGSPMPEMRPGEVRRAWMDEAPSAFPYRCLPLTIANGYGWELLCDTEIEAVWTGGQAPGDVLLRARKPLGRVLPVAHFGAGVVTFHVNALFRTEPGTALWVGGPPNAARDGIAALTGIVEADWAVATFTMNWRFTRAHHPVRFLPGEAFCFVFPLRTREVAETDPVILPLDTDPELRREHVGWSSARGGFNAALHAGEATGWQRHYHRGEAPGGARASDHVTKAGARPFRRRD